VHLVLKIFKGNEATNLAKRPGSLLKVGLFTSAMTLVRLSSGATKYKGILRFGCIATRSDILSRPEYIDVVLSISKAAAIAFPSNHSTSISSIVRFVTSSNCKRQIVSQTRKSGKLICLEPFILVVSCYPHIQPHVATELE
jgi:hypothetical protein